MPALSELSLLDQCRAIWGATTAREEAEARARLEPPLVRVWTGDFALAGVLSSEYTAEFTWLDNEAGTGLTEIPLWDPLAKWIWQVKDRINAGEKRNVFITVDKDGARWSGILFDHTVEKRADGTHVLVVRWMHDLFTLQHYLAWCNPFLPDFVQFPRVFFLAGPSIWGLKTALFLNVMREQENWWELPSDPMNQGSAPATMMSNWSVAIKPTTFMDDMNAGTIWSIPNSRFKYWMDMSKDILEDAQLSIQVRRYIADDDAQPIAGQTLRNGCLVVDIVDKSGYYTDTSNGGDPFLGLKRTFAQIAEDFIDEIIEDVVDPAVPNSYKTPGLKLTDKICPYVVYLEGEETGIESSKFTFTPSTAVQMVAGGHSFPFVNELISATIQTLGDLLAMAIFVPPIGGALDAVLQPLYWDTVAAWMHFRSPGRKAHSGWAHLFEYRASDGDRAYTLEALLSLRKAFHDTRSWFSHEVLIRDGAPWFIGDNGKGHFFLGDRIGAQVLGDFSAKYGFDDFTIYVDRVRELTLAWDRDSFAEWKCTIGEKEKNKDRGQRALGMISDLFALMRDVGALGR
ncbi:phage tail protein [Nocardia sp. NPDC049707]|uniref:Gp37-like protein n=1 Tax=Nocardia sp. NPDC049707 TaxID=3154735 RepID=UPI0034421968